MFDPRIAFSCCREDVARVQYTAGVVGIELQAEVWGVDVFQDRQCVIEIVEFVIWNVEGVIGSIKKDWLG